jgi:hypothetical protein
MHKAATSFIAITCGVAKGHYYSSALLGHVLCSQPTLNSVHRVKAEGGPDQIKGRPAGRP